jgi:hypothetical protein
VRTNLGETDAVLEAVDLFLDSFARSIPTGYGNPIEPIMPAPVSPSSFSSSTAVK